MQWTLVRSCDRRDEAGQRGAHGTVYSGRFKPVKGKHKGNPGAEGYKKTL